MASLTRCKKGHFYDADKHRKCPYCLSFFDSNGFSTTSDVPPSAIPVQYRSLGEISFIGKGSSSRVYRIRGEKEYALKITECEESSAKMQAALNEIEFLKKLSSSEKSIHMFDYRIESSDQSSNSTTVYILEEYLTSLHEYIKQNTFTVRKAIDIAIRICDAAIVCREIGIAHLDIQPKNLFITENGDIKLGDFSSSSPVGTSPDSLRGTLAFMAPEVYRSLKYSEQSEVYSVGSVIYYLFNGGKLPFQSGSDKEVAVYKKLAGTALPEFSFRSLIFSLDITNIVRKACAYETSERYASLQELKHDLIHLLTYSISVADDIIKKESPENTDSITSVMLISTPLQMTNSVSVKPHNSLSVNETIKDFSPTNYSTKPAASADSNQPTADPFVSAAFQPTYTPSPTFEAAPPPTAGKPRFSTFPAIRPHFPSLKKKKSLPGKVPAKTASPPVPTAVEFSAVAPNHLIKGDYTIINLIMYEKEYRSIVDDILHSSDSVQEIRQGMYQIQQNSSVRVHLTSPDFEITEEEEQVWYSGYLNFSFAVQIPEDFSKRQILFQAAVYIDGLLVTKLKFIVKCFTLREQKLKIIREDILSAFVSYASQDRNRVARIIQGMKKINPDIEIFFDVDTLRSGEDWEQALWAEIQNRDIFFLCWSHFAKASEWVEKEWRYALSTKGLDCIEPIPIEPPNICPPPEELSKKHFNDRLLHLTASAEQDIFPGFSTPDEPGQDSW